MKNEKITLEKDQLNIIVELAKNNPGLDTDLLLQAIGISSEGAVEVDLQPVEANTGYRRSRKGKHWSKQEDQMLLELLKETDLTTNEIAKRMQRTKNSIYSRINYFERLSGKKTESIVRRKYWGSDELEILDDLLEEYGEARLVPDDDIKELADLTDRTKNAVEVQLYKVQKRNKKMKGSN